ncbi:regulatory protein RecX [Piscinibacter sakaiensis]|uniref:Regulatory protein RecX n=1 Tax=Piscinibacter sakaiensis TaxID=1547922 RepID=A0A0K8P1L5_PISS1|nr:regulatory protein RecX [Piscinibacter sakaiensis]GAP36429.1 regulatory protein RecX [Piscinibacter sakaiensis]
MSPSRSPLSLRARAVAWLAQRDHSEAELRAKLQRAQQQERQQQQQLDEDGAARRADPALDVDPAQAIDDVFSWLRSRGYLDDRRFVASRIAARQSQRGLAKIRHELGRHGLSLADDDAALLRGSEFERALALWQRRFGVAATEPREAARQARFLAGRGFGGDTVRRVLRQAGSGDALAGEAPAHDGPEASRTGPGAGTDLPED